MSSSGLIANLTNYIKAGYRSNAYAPLVWAMGLIFIILLILFGVLDSKFHIWLLIILSVVILFGLVMYLILYLKDPRLLQSESFRLEDKKLDLILEKGSDFAVNPVNLTTPNGEQHLIDE